MTSNEKVEPPGALAGLRVLDFSRVLAGPYCSMVLSDYGAEVIKVERPGSGDDTRRWGPPWVGSESAYFLSVNRNKRSVALDLKSEAGQKMARRLAARSDVLIENFRPGKAEAMRLGYAELAQENPGLVYCSISGYGRSGPYRDRPGYDFIIQAQGGLMSITGPDEGGPHKVGVAIVDVSAGLFAATAILAALQSRGESGVGQHIDISLLDSQVAWLVNVAQNYLTTGKEPSRHGNAHPNIVPYEMFPTSDGEIAVAVGNDSQFERFCQAVDRPDLWADERYRSNGSRVENRDILIPELGRLFETRPTSDWLDVLLAAAIPASAINDIPSVLADPQVRARDMVQSATHETLGEIELIGPAAKFSHTPASVRAAPPLLGADTREVLTDLAGCTVAELDDLEARGVIQTRAEEKLEAES